MGSRKHRHTLIRRILQDHTVSSQEQLAELLGDAGISCTQATLSRDLRDMGITRDRGPDGPVYRIDNSARYMKMLREVVGMEIRSIRHNGAMVVIRTLQGRASGVAGFLDGWDHPDILGTVAGDDTVFVAPTDHTGCEALAAEIRSLSNGELELP